MDTVSFTQMKDGTAEDYALLRQHEKDYMAGTGRRILAEMARQGDETIGGYKVTRLQHSLQTATRAKRDGADADWVVGALLHDIGDSLAPQNHAAYAATVLRPYVREDVCWAVEQHGIFQMVYYAHHYGWPTDEHLAYRDHPYYQSCVDFCARWDQAAFDPDYPTEPLEYFAPMVQEVFSRKAYDPEILRPGYKSQLYQGD